MYLSFCLSFFPAYLANLAKMLIFFPVFALRRPTLVFILHVFAHSSKVQLTKNSYEICRYHL